MNKSDFPIFKKHPQLVYLDNAATSQKPQVVIDAVLDFYTNTNANVHRGIHKLAEEATIRYENARDIIAKFLRTDSSEIIFTSGTTESINLIAQMLFEYYVSANSTHNHAHKTKQSILISEMEHHANLIPWQKLAEKLGWDLEFIKTTANFQLDEEDLRNKLNRDTAILALTQMSNVLGIINDIETICAFAKSINPDIVTVIDGAQYIPHHKIDLGKQKAIDFYCFSGHKMLGPTGIGVLYGKKAILEQLEPAKFGGGMIAKVEKQNSTWAELPEKFEAGTPHIAGAIGLGAAVNYLNDLDSHKLQNHTKELITYTAKELRSLPEITLFYPSLEENSISVLPNSPTTSSSTVFSFAVQGIHPHDVAQLLDQDNIAIRAGHHCCQILHRETLQVPATNRASLYFYNETDDIDQLIKSLKKIISKFR